MSLKSQPKQINNFLIAIPRNHIFCAMVCFAGVLLCLARPAECAGKSNSPKLPREAGTAYVVELSSRTAVDEAKLRLLFDTGYGRKEMAAVVLISVKSGAPLDEVSALRDTLMPLRKIAAIYSLSYKNVIMEAEELKSGIEKLIYSADYKLKSAGESQKF